MKVGLVRHFRVKKPFPEKIFISQKEVFQWLDEYECCDVQESEVDLGDVDWQKCYVSDIPRALKTAETIYKGPIIKTKELREIRPYPIFKWNLKLPFLVWGALGRLAFLISHHSQLGSKADLTRRLKIVLEDILSKDDENVLIVSHGGLMMGLRDELIKRGFTGPSFGTPRNAKLYLFER